MNVASNSSVNLPEKLSSAKTTIINSFELSKDALLAI